MLRFCSLPDRFRNWYQVTTKKGSICLRSTWTQEDTLLLKQNFVPETLLTLAPFVIPCGRKGNDLPLACVNKPTLKKLEWFGDESEVNKSNIIFRFTDGKETTLNFSGFTLQSSLSYLRAMSCKKLPTDLRIPWPEWKSVVPNEFKLGPIVDDSGKAKQLYSIVDHPSVVAMKFKSTKGNNGANGYNFARDPLAYMRELRILANCNVPVLPVEVQGEYILAPKLKATVPEADNSNHTMLKTFEALDQASKKKFEIGMLALGRSIATKQWTVSEDLQFGMTRENDFVVFDPDEPLTKGEARFEGEHRAMEQRFLFYWNLYFRRPFVH
jgi:hypothetical protein